MEKLRHQIKPFSLAHGRFRNRSCLSGCSAYLTSCSSRWQTFTKQLLSWSEAQRKTTFHADLSGWPRLAQSSSTLQYSIRWPPLGSGLWLYWHQQSIHVPDCPLAPMAGDGEQPGSQQFNSCPPQHSRSCSLNCTMRKTHWDWSNG